MSETHVHELLLAYVNGNLDPAAKVTVSAHLAVCEECRKESEEMMALWTSLRELPDEKPSPELRPRFYDALRAYEEATILASPHRARPRAGIIEYLLSRRPGVQVGFALALLVIGIVIGYQLRADRLDQAELAQLRGEVGTMNRLLAISLMQQQSASERLRGVSISNQVDDADPEIAGALFQALKYDPNVNVRLAALDALARNATSPAVRHELIETLGKQTSPLVQIAIIDLLVHVQEKESIRTLREMMADPMVNDAVKKKIEQGIQQLS